nr:hypothetical protein [Tanacetum cinerariifolium]
MRVAATYQKELFAILEADYKWRHQPIVGLLGNLKSENETLEEFWALHQQLDTGSNPDGFQREERLLIFCSRYYVGTKSKLKALLLREFHDTPSAGHESVKKMIHRSFDSGGPFSKYAHFRALPTNFNGHKIYGPYEIVERIEKVAYRLALPVTSKIPPLFHVSILNLFTRTSSEMVMELPDEFKEGKLMEQPVGILPPLPFSSAVTFANIMCHHPLPPPLSPPSAKLMIVALKEYGYQSTRGIHVAKKWMSSYFDDVI